MQFDIIDILNKLFPLIIIIVEHLRIVYINHISR